MATAELESSLAKFVAFTHSLKVDEKREARRFIEIEELDEESAHGRTEARVIAVILPDAKSNPEVPLFLRGFHAIDFRISEPDPLEQLIWGITDERPA